MKQMGIAVYGCQRDEAAAFQAFSPRFGVIPAMTRAAVSKENAAFASGNRCVSVGHRSRVCRATLLALRETGVQYISTRSVGVDHIDVEAARGMGMVVENVSYSPGSVADYTVMLMLMAVRNAKSMVSRAGENDFRLDDVRGRELREMTVGILGTGRIGKAVIERLHGFGCRVLAHDRSGEAGSGHVSLRALLEQSDIVSLHVPLCQDTYHMIGREQIHAMKRGAFLINTARGGVVDTGALMSALETGKLGGAALDVLEGEEGIFYSNCAKKPMGNRRLDALRQMPNVIITPHAAYYTERTLRDTVRETIVNCVDFERKKSHA